MVAGNSQCCSQSSCRSLFLQLCWMLAHNVAAKVSSLLKPYQLPKAVPAVIVEVSSQCWNQSSCQKLFLPLWWKLVHNVELWWKLVHDVWGQIIYRRLFLQLRWELVRSIAKQQKKTLSVVSTQVSTQWCWNQGSRRALLGAIDVAVIFHPSFLRTCRSQKTLRGVALISHTEPFHKNLDVLLYAESCGCSLIVACVCSVLKIYGCSVSPMSAAFLVYMGVACRLCLRRS